MMLCWENGQKPQFGQFFVDFKVNYLQISNFSEKLVSFKLKVIFSINFWPKTKKIVKTIFEKNIKVSDFGLIWRPFHEYLQINNFFQKSGSVTFLPLYSPNFMQKLEKSLEPFLRKLCYQPTNLPTTSCKKSEKSFEPFLRKLCYQPANQPTSQPMLIWRPFCEYLKIKNFFQKSSSVIFLPL